MHRWIGSILGLSFLCTGLAVAQTPTPARPFTYATERSIDRLALNEVRLQRTAAIAIGVVEDGSLVYARGFGFADVSTRRPATAATEFYVGSLAKQFTAAAVLLLAQNKQLSLDDKVTKYVPELTVAKDVTVAELLQQTSGLASPYSLPGISNNLVQTVKMDTLLQAVNKVPLAFDPGSKFDYNNFNYMVAGLIVARVSRVPLSVYMQTHIFEPMVMTSTFLAGDQGISPQHAYGYTRERGTFQRAPGWSPSWLFGAGGVVSNVYDLAKWDIGLPLLLNVDSLREMWTASKVPGAMQYGMGWVIDQRGGHPYVWHNGEISGFHAMNAILPDAHIAVIVLTNTDSLHDPAIEPEHVANQILDIVAPLPQAHFQSLIMQRAQEWLGRLARNDIDRTQLTPAFNTYLTDAVVHGANIAALGKIVTMTPLESYTSNGDTVYIFSVRFAHGAYDYTFSVNERGKIDGLYFKAG